MSKTDPTTTGPDPEYTREEMREACRNNYNAALEAACGALAAVAIKAQRPECCNIAAYDREQCCGNPNLLVIAYDVAQAIRALKEVPMPSETTIPTFISYDPRDDLAFVWLKGGAAPGEITVTLPCGAISLGFDAAGHLLLIEMPGEALHPDLVPHTARDYPAEGNL